MLGLVILQVFLAGLGVFTYAGFFFWHPRRRRVSPPFRRFRPFGANRASTAGKPFLAKRSYPAVPTFIDSSM